MPCTFLAPDEGVLFFEVFEQDALPIIVKEQLFALTYVSRCVECHFDPSFSENILGEEVLFAVVAVVDESGRIAHESGINRALG